MERGCMQGGEGEALVKDSRRPCSTHAPSIRFQQYTLHTPTLHSPTLKWIMATHIIHSLGFRRLDGWPSFPDKIHGGLSWGWSALEQFSQKELQRRAWGGHFGKMCILLFSFLKDTLRLKINFLNCIVNCWSLISAKCDWNLGEKWTCAPAAAAGPQSIWSNSHCCNVSQFLQILFRVHLQLY